MNWQLWVVSVSLCVWLLLKLVAILTIEASIRDIRFAVIDMVLLMALCFLSFSGGLAH